MARTVVVYTFGELTEERSKLEPRLPYGRPTGCEWFRDCKLCSWPDCIIPDKDKPLNYHSKKAYEKRARVMIKWHREEGKTLREIAGFFRMSVPMVENYINLQVESPQALRSMLKRFKALKRERDMQILKLTNEGMSVKGLAIMFNVTPRTIYRSRANRGTVRSA